MTLDVSDFVKKLNWNSHLEEGNLCVTYRWNPSEEDGVKHISVFQCPTGHEQGWIETLEVSPNAYQVVRTLLPSVLSPIITLPRQPKTRYLMFACLTDDTLVFLAPISEFASNSPIALTWSRVNLGNGWYKVFVRSSMSVSSKSIAVGWEDYYMHNLPRKIAADKTYTFRLRAKRDLETLFIRVDNGVAEFVPEMKD
jgi:hypothetical protein